MADKRYTFKDVMYEYFISKNHDCPEYERVDKFRNFHMDRVKEWNKILHILDVENEIDEIKQSTNFVFDEEDKDFIISVFKEYSGLLEPMRRGQIGAADYEFRIHLFEGFYEMFRKSVAAQDIKERAINKMYNRLDIPVCKIEAVCTTNSEHLRSMVDENIHTAYFGMDTQLKYTWLTAFAMDYKRFIEKWSELFSFMSEERIEEINEHAAKAAENMSAELEEYAQIEFEYAEEINDALATNAEYQELYKEYCRIRGEQYSGPVLSKDIRTFVERYRKSGPRYKKRPFVDKVEKDFYKLCDELQEKQRDITQAVIRRHIPDYVIPDDDMEDREEYKSPDKIMEAAVIRQKENWEDEWRRKNTEPVELPEIDFDELKKRIRPFE